MPSVSPSLGASLSSRRRGTGVRTSTPSAHPPSLTELSLSVHPRSGRAGGGGGTGLRTSPPSAPPPSLTELSLSVHPRSGRAGGGRSGPSGRTSPTSPLVVKATGQPIRSNPTSRLLV